MKFTVIFAAIVISLLTWKSDGSTVVAGVKHTCLINPLDGALYCKGNNQDGQVGNGSSLKIISDFKKVPGMETGVTQVSAGFEYTCAVKNGGVKCWGLNSDGQLGNGSSDLFSSVPVQVIGLASGVISVSTGGQQACALLVSGAVKCWGSNSAGELGNGNLNSSNVPVMVPALTSGVTAISMGWAHSCAVQNRRTKCWGANSSGQLGNGTNVWSNVPVPVTGLSDTTLISVGEDHSCAVLGDRSGIKCWGGNATGQLGNGTTQASNIPVSVINIVPKITDLSAGFGYTCINENAGTKCWGKNSSGELGIGTTVNTTTSTSVVGLTSGVTTLSAGFDHTCAMQNGVPKCWGNSNVAQISYTLTPAIQTVTNPTSAAAAFGIRSVITGVGNLMNLLNNTLQPYNLVSPNVLTASGNYFVRAGAVYQTGQSAPVNGLLSNVTEVNAGWHHNCAIQNGGAKCWGSNGSGELGNGTNDPSELPRSVSRLDSGVTRIALGRYHSCAVQSGSAKCWGNNDYGQLGNGSNISSNIPVTVSGLTTGVTRISVGNRFSCALQNADVKCWGSNESGQLGNGSTRASLTPVTVTGLNGVNDLSAGLEHVCALKNGGVKCWGNNETLVLGKNDLNYSIVPIDILGLMTGVQSLTPISSQGQSGHEFALSSGEGSWPFKNGVDTCVIQQINTQNLFKCVGISLLTYTIPQVLSLPGGGAIGTVTTHD